MKVAELPSKPILARNFEQAELLFTAPHLLRNISKSSRRIQNGIQVHLVCYYARKEIKNTVP